MTEAFENIELPLRDICEELKELNKRMEVSNEILFAFMYKHIGGKSSGEGFIAYGDYLRNRKQ